METLNDRQRNVAMTLIDWVLAHRDGTNEDICMDETALAKAVDNGPWHRGYLDDLKALCNYSDRMNFPMISLLVVIPGFGKPERRIMTEAYKTTLSTVEGEKRWSKDLTKIRKTKVSVWKDFKKALEEQEEAANPKRPAKKSTKKATAKKTTKATEESEAKTKAEAK